jgi:hypothetical protein
MFNAYKNQATEPQAYEALRLAQIHAETTTKPMKSSAASCAKDAAEFFNQGRFGFAHEWALESLRYSVGILHPDFTKATQGVKRG